ncbi:MAG: hypothetical protein ACREM8_13625, partial [Vulcanimicrobiaceae bacterium]
MDAESLRAKIEQLAGRPDDVRGAAGAAVDEVIAALDDGRLRVCEPIDGTWTTHAWIKRAILLYFRRQDNVRIVPPAVTT